MRILVVDDHDLIRKSLVIMLKRDFKDATFLEASNGLAAIQMVKEHTIDLILSDISMPKLNGIEMIKQLFMLEYRIPILILSMQLEHQYAVRAIKAGAYGYISKSADPKELVNAVQIVMSGKKYITPSIADLLVDTMSKSDKEMNLNSLSDREMEVLLLISKGRKVSEIAHDISLSVNTISTYRSRILDKLSLKTNSDLIRYALEQGLN